MRQKIRKDNQQTYLLIAGAVAIAVIVALVLNGSGNPGGALLYGEKVPGAAQTQCVDDDPGNDFFLAGTVRQGVYLYEDHCDEEYLHQQFCKTGRHVSHTRPYKCPNGCLNGACLK
jgi:hypothetical protein